MERLDGRHERKEKPEDLGTLVRRLRIQALAEHARADLERGPRG